jgi:hypothetical protein
LGPSLRLELPQLANRDYNDKLLESEFEDDQGQGWS